MVVKNVSIRSNIVAILYPCSYVASWPAFSKIKGGTSTAMLMYVWTGWRLVVSSAARLGFPAFGRQVTTRRRSCGSLAAATGYGPKPDAATQAARPSAGVGALED
jgi:hypothetical protein